MKFRRLEHRSRWKIRRGHSQFVRGTKLLFSNFETNMYEIIDDYYAKFSFIFLLKNALICIKLFKINELIYIIIINIIIKCIMYKK